MERSASHHRLYPLCLCGGSREGCRKLKRIGKLNFSTNSMNCAYYNCLALEDDGLSLPYMGECIDIRNALYLEDKEKAKKMLKGAYSLYDNMYSKYALSSSKYMLKLNKDLNFYFNQLPKLFKDKFPSDFIKKDIKERTLIINRILKINNLMSSTMNALMGLYSSPDINYILAKYRKKLYRV